MAAWIENLLAGAVTAGAAYLLGWRKSRSDLKNVDSNTTLNEITALEKWQQLYKNAMDQIDHQHTENMQLKSKLDALQSDVNNLIVKTRSEIEAELTELRTINNDLIRKNEQLKQELITAKNEILIYSTRLKKYEP